MKKTIRYGLMLSDAELDYLSENKYGINRIKVLRCLIGAAVMEDTPYEKKGFSTTLKAGQAILSEVELASRLGYDKKTVSRLIDRFNRMGIVASTQGNRTSIHELRCLAAWYVDGKEIRNPCYVGRNKPNAKPCAEAGYAQHEGRENNFPAIAVSHYTAGPNSNSNTSEADAHTDSRGNGRIDVPTSEEAEPIDDVLLSDVSAGNETTPAIGNQTAGEI